MKKFIAPYRIMYKKVLYEANDTIRIDDADADRMSRIGTVIADETEVSEQTPVQAIEEKPVESEPVAKSVQPTKGRPKKTTKK